MSATSTIATIDPSVVLSLGEPTFTPEPVCTKNIYYLVYDDIDCGDVACRWLHLGDSTKAPECMPTDWKEDNGFFQSPGVCPDGYTFACASSTDGGPETTATCCPSGYGCLTTTYWPWHSTEICMKEIAPTIPFIYTTLLDGQDPSPVSTGGITDDKTPTVHAYGLEIRFQSTDLSAPTSSTGQSVTSGTTSGSFSQSELPDTQEEDEKGLSTGAQAGIGVGAAIGGLGMILLAWLLWRRRKRVRVEGSSVGELPGAEPSQKDPSMTSPTQLEPSAHVQRYEMYVEPNELDGHGHNRAVEYERGA